ncbi:hypothetical protein [Halalkalibacterium ligniniphilum]|uniref:hypothetical protein n=1 Tax=Halalkalibacterium ligniniphilum TaxID=1134413 RepID=UPI00034A2267|nr:hypothetical protein [Halalkalibacterium ligniniphilum]
MNKITHLFIFDLKLLRYLYIFPFLFYGLSFFLILLFGERFDDPFMPYISVQGLAVPMAGWHLVFIYNSVFEEGSKETLIRYYRKNIIFDITRHFLLHGIFISLLTSLTISLKGIDFFSGVLFVHLLMLYIFFLLIGIAILSATESLDITLAIIAAYTFIEVITQGTFMPWPHLFIFEEPVNNLSLYLTFFSLMAGIIYSIIQLWVKFK